MAKSNKKSPAQKSKLPAPKTSATPFNTQTPTVPDAPRLWIIAGPNGSGKSTLYWNTNLVEEMGKATWIINPDLLSLRLRDQERKPELNANIEALKRIQKWLQASIRAHQTVGVETVLSTDKYRALVKQAKRHGFEVWLLYVTLKNVRLNIRRVAMRVEKGGHPVPVDKIRSRWKRSYQQLPWFLYHADGALIYDNSTANPVLIGQKTGKTIYIDPNAPRVLKTAINSILKGEPV